MWVGGASATGAWGAGLLLERPCQQCDLTLQSEATKKNTVYRTLTVPLCSVSYIMANHPCYWTA